MRCESGVASQELADGGGDREGVVLALLPGSRRSEIQRNWPTMREAFVQLRRKHPALAGVIAAVDEQGTRWIREAGGANDLPEGARLVVGRTDDVLHDADVALVVSGTATLQTAAHDTPM